MSDGGGPQRGRRATVIVAGGMDYSLAFANNCAP